MIPLVWGGFVPTGRNDGVGFGWGSYRTPMGEIRMKGTSNKTFSLSHENARYIDSVPLGHKSAAVNTALTWYRGQGVEVHELLANIEGLQEKITQLCGEGEAPNPVPSGWPQRVISTIKRWFHI